MLQIYSVMFLFKKTFCLTIYGNLSPDGQPTKFAPIPKPAPERAVAPIDGT